jgi:hypothetical protein
MSGGAISGNIAGNSGGGVYTTSDSNFSKAGDAIIYGNDPPNSNTVHAVYVDNGAKGNPRREDTTGAGDNLSYTGADNPANATYTGTWTTGP